MKTIIKKRFSFLLFVSVCFGMLSQSCADFLSTEPQDFTAPEDFYKNEKQLMASLTSIYSTLSDSRLYGANYINRMGADGEENYYRTDEKENVALLKFNASNIDISNFWDNLYVGINHANMLLANIDDAEMTNEENRDVIRGEALFLRGYFYFLLVTNFGDVPLVVTPTLSLDNLKVPRTSSAEVYKQITGDMETAFDLVQTAEELGYGGRVSKSAVAGILARVYLHWAGEPVKDTSKYADARKWALTVMTPESVQFTHELISYEEVFKNYAADKYDIKESIWEVEFYGNNTGTYKMAGRVGDLNGIRSAASSSMGNANGKLRATATQFFKYEDDDDDESGYTDIRRDLAIASFSYKGDAKEYRTDDKTQIWGRDVGKYRREWEVVFPKTTYTPINYPLLRYSDVLLMFAEADNFVNNGPTKEALDAVNLVRGRAEASLLEGDNIPSGSQDFLRFLQEERSRELCFESLRKGDLIRWGIYIDTFRAMVATYKNTPDDGSTGLSSSVKQLVMGLDRIEKKHLLWPIPTNERAVNSLLSQNEGW